jgi:hypothetical protein
VHGMRRWRPYAEGGAIGDEVRAHRSAGGDVIERSWHSQFYGTETRDAIRGIPGGPSPTNS